MNFLIFNAALSLLVGSVLLVAFRVARGPHLLDRVVALDFMAVVAVGMLGVYAIATDQPAYLDVAAVIALLSFLSTVGFAYYVERQRTNLSRGE
ncbi:cation:proton antiporter [Chloroflexi bacterium TSY]|nr:cation:proton antiporter [Chloroflexi bacterium TSY]